MKLNEWNDILKYAKEVVGELRNQNIDVKYAGDRSATDSNSHGIIFRVYDIDGKIFKRYNTGCEVNSFALMTKIAMIKGKDIKRMLNLHGALIPIGSVIYVVDAGKGAWGCNFEDVKVLSHCSHDVVVNSYYGTLNAVNGLSNGMYGFLVSKLSDDSVWKIYPPTKDSFKFKDKNVVELI